MLTVKEIITRVRDRTHDEQETGYTDATLLGYINDGVRFMRRTIIDINPALIADVDLEGTLTAGTSKLPLEVTETDEDNNETTTSVTVTHIAEVRVDGRRLAQINKGDIPNTTRTGIPTHYYVQGFNTIGFYPIPANDYDYEVVALKDVTELTKDEDTSPFPNEFDDFLYEYVALRASLSNEFDMSQESSVMGQIITQIERMMQQLQPDGVQINGYWDPPIQSRIDYGVRR